MVAEKQFDPSVSIIRVLAMLSIIIGHWMTMQGINHYQFGAIGVQIFLFISGWLQSGKQISNLRKWIWKKWKRIMIPFYIVLGMVVGIRLLLRFEVRLEALLTMLLNLQGLEKLFYRTSISVIAGYGQTWFLTVLVVCYMLTLMIKQFPVIEDYIRKHLPKAFITAVVLQMVLAFVHIQIGGIICYFLGYFWNREKPCSVKNYGGLTAAMLFITGARFVTHMFFDNSLFYNGIVFTWAFNVLGIWLTLTLMMICGRFQKYSHCIASSRMWMFLDMASYPLFLTHYMFVKGELSVEHWNLSDCGQFVVFILLSLALAMIVLALTELDKLRALCAKKG